MSGGYQHPYQGYQYLPPHPNDPYSSGRSPAPMQHVQVHPVVVQPDRFRPLAPRPDNTQATSIIPPAPIGHPVAHDERYAQQFLDHNKPSGRSCLGRFQKKNDPAQQYTDWQNAEVICIDCHPDAHQRAIQIIGYSKPAPGWFRCGCNCGYETTTLWELNAHITSQHTLFRHFCHTGGCEHYLPTRGGVRTHENNKHQGINQEPAEHYTCPHKAVVA